MIEKVVKFQRSGFSGERLVRLGNDGLRWRWWRFYCLSDFETFPGLVAKGVVPIPEMSIVGEVYQSKEFNGSDKIAIWKKDKQVLIDVDLVRTTVVGGQEYLWNVDFHVYQDKYSKKGAQLRDRFYDGFLKLNEKDKAVFVVLMSKFKPSDIDQSVFFIPELLPQFDLYVNKRMPLFNPGGATDGNIKPLIAKVTERVQQTVVKEESEGKSQIKEFVDWYCQKYQEIIGKPYMRGGKDYKLVGEMLKVFPTSELKTLGMRFLKEQDAFVKKAGFTIGVFKTMVNRLVGTKEKRPRGLDDYSRYR